MIRNLGRPIIEARVNGGDIGGHILWNPNTEEPLLERVGSDFFIPHRDACTAQGCCPVFAAQLLWASNLDMVAIKGRKRLLITRQQGGGTLGYIATIHHIQLHVPKQLGENAGRLDGLHEVEETLEIIGRVEDHMVYSTVVQVLLNVIMRGPVPRPISPTKIAQRRDLGDPTHPLDLARINEVTLKAALLRHIVTGT